MSPLQVASGAPVDARHSIDTAPYHDAVADLTDPRISAYTNLKESAERLRSGGLFIAETPVVVERLLTSQPDVIESVLVSSACADWASRVVPPQVTVLVAPQAVLDEIAGYPVHRGVLALGRRPEPSRLELDSLIDRLGFSSPAREPATVLVCEGIRDPENVGSLFRVAAALGVDALVLDPTCHDPLYRRAVRVSVGYVMSVPWAWAAPWPSALERLRSECGFRILGASLSSDARDVSDAATHLRTAILVGSEYDGLSDGATSLCDELVRIPMASGVDSLNVAVAAGILLDRLGSGNRVAAYAPQA